MKKKLILFIIILIVVFILILSLTNNKSEDGFIDGVKDGGLLGEEYSSNYIDGKVYYKAIINKPTPCHKVEVEEIFLESYPVQIELLIDIIPSDEVCAQVIAEEIVEGTIEIDHKPGRFSIKFNNEEVYSTNFEGELELCSKGDQKLSLEDAKEIAINSECNQGELKDNAFCNENTGTWWIDLDIEKEGCNPACVIDVVTKTAEINWRCTGLTQ